jgi:ribokinase
MRVHVVGNVCIDTTFRLTRFPRPGETMNATVYAQGLGGKGANQAIAATRTGSPVTLWTAIGRDADSRWMRDRLAGVIQTLRLTELDLPGDRSTIAVDSAGENIIISGVLCAQAFDPLRQTDLLQGLQSGDVLVMQGNLLYEVTSQLTRAAHEKGALTVLNASPLDPEHGPDLGAVDIIVVNEGEAESITELADPHLAARRLLALGAGAAVITLGSRGCLLMTSADAHPMKIPAPETTAVDTSGAGDVLCGIFAGYLAQKKTPAVALGVAVRAAALAVTRPGTLESCPSAEEVSDLVKNIETEKP